MAPTWKYMPVSLEFLRGMLVLLAIFFAYMAGRSIAASRRGRVAKSRVYAWIIRLTVCSAAVAYRSRFDLIDIALCVLAALALAAGYWEESRPKSQEDLTRKMFPEN
jgi:hypothetical protein